MTHYESNRVIVTDLRHADNFFTRLKGLIGCKPLQEGQGLLISPCQQVHTHFMAYPIDILFLDREYRVVHTIESLMPWRFSRYVRVASHVLELPAGAAHGIHVGDRLVAD